MLELTWILYAGVLSLLAVYGAHRLLLTWRAWHLAPQGSVEAPELPAELPRVTVQLPLYNEFYVAERVIAAAAALDWPADRLHLQILDDSTDETSAHCARLIAELKARGLQVDHLRRSNRRGFKAGALAAGLAATDAELILVLDADFVPPPSLLRDTVGHFADPSVGMVQVRWEHLNRCASLLTRVQSILLDGHFVIEQNVRAQRGQFFNFNGTAGIWRRSAIESAGGWQADTLTEDLDLSYRALLAGWRFVYRLDAAAPAELPADMNAFKSQQFRWAKGSVQVARKVLPAVLRARLPLHVKLEAALHLTQNLPHLLMLLLVLLAVPALLLRGSASAAETWLVHMPTLLVSAVTAAAYAGVSQHSLGRDDWRGALWRAPALVAVAAGLCVSQARAVVEGALGHQTPFVRTPKHGGAAATGRWRRLRYRGMPGPTCVAELFLGAYFAAACALGWVLGTWAVLPAFILLCAGFSYVGTCSLLRR